MDYWLENLRCAFDWWADAPCLTVQIPRLCLWIMQASATVFAAAFAAWRWQVWRGPITIE